MNCLLTDKIFVLWLTLILNQNIFVEAQEQAFVQLGSDPEYRIVSGKEQYITISFLIKEDYHIQADQVKDENLIPSALSFEAPEELMIGDPVFPKPVEFKMEGVEETLDVYSNLIDITVPVKMVSAENKEFLINGKLHYQACDASKCYFPRDFNFIMKINAQ